jgi:hypothetical protein
MTGMAPLVDNPVIVPNRKTKGDHKPGASEPPRIRCPLCGWSPRKEDKWFCTCGHDWNTFDTGGVCPPACTSGLRRSASLAADGRCILVCQIVGSIRVFGLLATRLGSRRQNAATTGTKGYGRASRRAFDWQQRCRLR